MAFHPTTHELYGSASGPDYTGALIHIDTTTGSGTLLGLTQALSGLAFHPETLVLFGVDNGIGGNEDARYTLDISTGEATYLGSPGLGNPLGLAFFVYSPTRLEPLSWGSVKACYSTEASR